MELHQVQQRGNYSDIPTTPNAAASISGTDPLVARVRLQGAAWTALAEMTSEGLLVQVGSPNATVSVPVRYGQMSGGEHMHVGQPVLAAGYQIARRAKGDLLRILDVDLFIADLGPLGLDARARGGVSRRLLRRIAGVFTCHACHFSAR